MTTQLRSSEDVKWAFRLAIRMLAVRVLSASDLLSRKAVAIGETAEYLRWGRRTFGSFVPLAKREQLWLIMLERLHDRRLKVLEFGVAWGYTTGWWLARMPHSSMQWHGFDRFTGLPRAWRDLPAGYFDAGGEPPRIQDGRVTWYVGEIEEQIGKLDVRRQRDERWLVFFDMDLLEPSLVAWRYISPYLQSGDLLYFDEAFDRDERHLLEHYVLPGGEYLLVGCTTYGLCLEVVARCD